jgi:hypothetical protein
MSKEVEAQILYIDYDKVIDKIKSLDAELKFDWVKFRIAVFNPCLTPEEQSSKYNVIFTRVRDEGLGTTTITTKTKTKDDANGKFVNEYEIETPSSFDNARELLLSNHLNLKGYQERLRQKWIIPARPEIKEIVFDIWPGLPMHMEVEASTESDLTTFLDELGIDKTNIRYSSATGFYGEILGITPNKINNQTPDLSYGTVNTVLGPFVTDKRKFAKILAEQKKYLTRFGFKSLLDSDKKINKSKGKHKTLKKHK